MNLRTTRAIARDADGRRAAAFTMVEIALCLGVIAIALVAIIGVMPTGLQVQKDNREDTIINQDGTLWVEAIRGGGRGLDYLTNYVDSITITNVSRNGVIVTKYVDSSGPTGPGIERLITNGHHIIGLLSRPKYLFPVTGPETNYIAARVRAVSGSAVDKDTTNAVRAFAFAYQLKSEVIAMNAHPTESTNFVQAKKNGLPPDEVLTRSNLWLLARNQSPNFYELLLTLQGPVVEKGDKIDVLGTPKVFRTLIGGFPRIEEPDPGKPFYFIQPSVFMQVNP